MLGRQRPGFRLWPLAGCQPPNPMPTRLDDNKRTLQFVFAVQAQGTLKLGMHRSLGRRQDTEIDNPRTTTPDKDQPAEITIAGDEDTALLMSNSKQLGVISLCKTKLSYRGNVMSHAAQKRIVVA